MIDNNKEEKQAIEDILEGSPLKDNSLVQQIILPENNDPNDIESINLEPSEKFPKSNFLIVNTEKELCTGQKII